MIFIKKPADLIASFWFVRLSLRTNFRYTNFCRKFYERRLFFLPEVKPMVNILQKRFNHVGLREHFFDAFVWYVLVSSADIHRPPQKIKTPLNYITLDSY